MRFAILICALPNLAFAEGLLSIDCSFMSECVETEACAETEYGLQISYLPKRVSPAGMISKATKTDVSSTTSGLVAQRDGVTTYTSGDFFAGVEEKLIVAPSGDARLVISMGDVPMIISYHGTCEVPK